MESLLAAHTEAGDFLEQSVEGESVETSAEGPGTVIGRYKLLEEIGEGGFGVVYMAEQIEPIQRKVALKIVKAGMDTREVIARFEAERQALALMDHPNIAKILDAGVTGAADPQPSTLSSQLSLGRPYFVMELVQGIPITRFCDQMSLSTTERLELFMKVCQAVQHAHQKAIIHRDLKPSNVLVTLHDGTPVPKVIDFGVAKALGQKLTDKTLFTGFLRMVGTPAYMSPEQADLGGLDIDTRSDIYSLGVLLYELLTGLTPFDADTLREAALDEIRRIIRETEPPRPSTRLRALGDKLTEVARRRQMEAPRLIHFVRGDLDWIVMKCLEKDRRRRYDTANMLALDVQRHLDNEPIVARPPSKVYRFQKLVRRNKLVFAAGSAVAAALILGLGISTVALFREKAAREHGRRLLYAADMSLAFEALDNHELYEAKLYLDRHRPKDGEPDLRGWEWRHLWERCQSQEWVTLGSHKEAADALAFSPDGRLLASGGGRGEVKIWDLASTQQLHCLTNKGGWILALAFSPAGDWLAVSTGSGIRLWKTTTWQPEDSVLVATQRTESLCFTRDGQRLLASNVDDYGVWEVKDTLREIDPLENTPWYSPGQHASAVSSDGRVFVHPRSQAGVVLNDLVTGESLTLWKSGSVRARALALSPDDQWLAHAQTQGEVRIHRFDPRRGLGHPPAESLNLDTREAYALAFSPDSRLLAVGGDNGRIELWETETWQKQETLMGHLNGISDLAFSPDTNAAVLASTSTDGTVRLWKTAPREREDLLPFDSEPIGWDPDGTMFLWLDEDGESYSVRHAANWPVKVTRPLPYASSNVIRAYLGPDGRLLAFSLTNQTVRLWDSAANGGKGAERWSLPTQNRVGRLYFSPDGSLLFGWVSSGGRMWVWDVEQGRQIASVANAWYYFTYLPQFTADQRQLAIPYGWKGQICLWDFAGSGKITLFEGRHPLVKNLALSPDNTTVATVSWDGIIKLWDVASRKVIGQVEARGQPLIAVIFSPDSQ